MLEIVCTLDKWASRIGWQDQRCADYMGGEEAERNSEIAREREMREIER